VYICVLKSIIKETKMDGNEKWTLLFVVVYVVLGLIFAEAAGLFLIAQFSLTVTNYWLTFIMGYTFISVIAKLIAEVFVAIFSFFGLFT
jgi:hypothetical protein